MKIKNIALAALIASVGSVALAQSKDQYFPVLSYRTGAYAPNGVPWANGFVDYLKLTNARGGVNGVKISFEECETAYDTARSVECYERLKGKNGGATMFQSLSTGATFALTETGALYSWGSNKEGILGIGKPGDSIRDQYQPILV